MQGSAPIISMPFFSDEQLAAMDSSKRPVHIAIIPDGNRRWAKQHWLNAWEGHRRGADVVINTVQAAKELGIEIVTIYGFSTENWQRPRREVETVLWLIEKNLRERCVDMVESGIHFVAVGDTQGLPENLQRTLVDVQKQTEHCNDITLALAINYSGRNELCRACQKLLDDCYSGKVQVPKIDEQLLARYLDTKGHPDPDLLIRPGGERRLSNFLLWQLSYTELYFSQKLWPDFTPQDLYDAVFSFQERQRRLGA